MPDLRKRGMETAQHLKTSTITVISIPKPFYNTSDSIARLKEVRNENISVLENVTITVISIPKPFYSKSDSFARLKEARNGNMDSRSKVKVLEHSYNGTWNYQE